MLFIKPFAKTKVNVFVFLENKYLGAFGVISIIREDMGWGWGC